MRRALLTLAMALVLAMAFGGTALAGEVTGSGKGGPNGDGIPGAVGRAQSACLYSGLEDGGDYPGQPEGPGAPPQNWGHAKDSGIVITSRGASYVEIDGTVFGLPEGTVIIDGCNPHVGDHEPH